MLTRAVTMKGFKNVENYCIFFLTTAGKYRKATVAKYTRTYRR